jgi:hypothetical protein
MRWSERAPYPGQMNSAGSILVLAAVFLPVLVGLPLLARKVRRSGVGAGVLGPFEELWHPAAVRLRMAVETAEFRPAESPSPGDPPTGSG